ncbi:MAG: YabP/YqfC family sporulation protein [Clostridia bacterium]|nr:YabP/YqfC family sporulation protein [Clostridia bacterium]MBQ7047655.1 YabP/YqfC family sporulation protein [Clostridia bacterium]
MAENKVNSSAVLTGRSFLSLTGINEVISFDESLVSLDSQGTVLSISGQGLSIVKLSLESGELSVSGRIDAIIYTDDEPKKGFLAKLFS